MLIFVMLLLNDYMLYFDIDLVYIQIQDLIEQIFVMLLGKEIEIQPVNLNKYNIVR